MDYSSIQKAVVALLSALVLFYTASKVLPFTRIANVEVPNASDSDLICLTANVRMKNRAYHRLIALIKNQDPDIILLTEVDQLWIEHLEILQSSYRHHALMPQDNTYGMALYSKYRLSNTAIQFLVDADVPSIRAQIHLSESQTIQFIGLHPMPPAPHTIDENKDIELLKAASQTNENTLPTVVCGDLNDVAWSPTTRHFKHISKLLDPRVGRGFFSTYSVFVPGFRMPIDHFFLSDHFLVQSMSRHSAIGSDHFPISISLKLAESGAQIGVGNNDLPIM